jgi:hypothetical protein
MTDAEQLKAYADELGVPDVTLSMLIQSHRTLREFRLEHNVSMQSARDLAYKQVMEDYKARKVIAIDELRDMTMQEVIGLLTIDLAGG